MIKDALCLNVAVEFLTQSDLPLLEVADRGFFQKPAPSTALSKAGQG